VLLIDVPVALVALLVAAVVPDGGVGVGQQVAAGQAGANGEGGEVAHAVRVICPDSHPGVSGQASKDDGQGGWCYVHDGSLPGGSSPISSIITRRRPRYTRSCAGRKWAPTALRTKRRHLLAA